MNLWDSVHRGLEKASNEAGRIARGQRTRAVIDRIGRQISEQEAGLLKATLQLFETNMLTQPELQPLCQEIVQLRQQLAQLQQELQQLQTQNQQAAMNRPAAVTPSSLPPTQLASPPSFNPETGNAYATMMDDGSAQTAASSSSYYSYADMSAPIPAPPPPPNVPGSTQSSPQSWETVPPPPPDMQGSPQSRETVPPPPPNMPGSPQSWETVLPPPPPPQGTLAANSAGSSTGSSTCPQCRAFNPANSVFCQNCGTFLRNIEPSQSTARSESTPGFATFDQEATRASTYPEVSDLPDAEKKSE